MKPETGWTISDGDVLCVGWWRTRHEAIINYLYDLYSIDRYSGMWGGDALTQEQRFAWGRCKKRGDRAVRILITPLDPKRGA